VTSWCRALPKNELHSISRAARPLQSRPARSNPHRTTRPPRFDVRRYRLDWPLSRLAGRAEKRRHPRQNHPRLRSPQRVKTAAVIISASGPESDFVSRFFRSRFRCARRPCHRLSALRPHFRWDSPLTKKSPPPAGQRPGRGGRLSGEQRGESVSIAGHATCYIPC